MNKTDIATARSAIASASYSLEAVGKGRPAVLARLLSPGQPGAHIMQHGFSEDTFALALANVAVSATAKGADAAALHAAFKAIGATNASATRQALEKLTFVAEGMKEKPDVASLLASLYGAASPALPDTSSLW